MICRVCKLDQSTTDFYPRNKVCKGCTKKRIAQWVASNKDKVAGYKTQWAALNKEKVKQSRADWAARNPIKAKEVKARWLEKNPEKRKQAVRDYSAKNPNKTRANVLRRRARKAFVTVESISSLDIQRILNMNNGLCVYCSLIGREPVEAVEIDHVVPLASGGHRTKSNLVGACRFCNASKGAKDLKTWLASYNRSESKY